jgi:hypothetical protein
MNAEIPTLSHAISNLERLKEDLLAKIELENEEDALRAWKSFGQSILNQLEYGYIAEEPLNICKSAVDDSSVLPEDLQEEKKNIQEMEEMVLQSLRPKVLALIHIFNEADERGPAVFDFSDDDLESDFELELDWDDYGVPKKTITVIDIRKRTRDKQNDRCPEELTEASLTETITRARGKRKRSVEDGNDRLALTKKDLNSSKRRRTVGKQWKASITGEKIEPQHLSKRRTPIQRASELKRPIEDQEMNSPVSSSSSRHNRPSNSGVRIARGDVSG